MTNKCKFTECKYLLSKIFRIVNCACAFVMRLPLSMELLLELIVSKVNTIFCSYSTIPKLVTSSNKANWFKSVINCAEHGNRIPARAPGN